MANFSNQSINRDVWVQHGGGEKRGEDQTELAHRTETHPP